MIKGPKKIVDLPQELITEILLRLPVKILLRFRCVSKSWNSLISDDSHFATSHFQLSANKIFIIRYDTLVALSVDFDSSLNDYVSLSLNIWNPQSYIDDEIDTRIGGSCRGFLFIHNEVGLYLLNPSTRVHKQIPVSPMTIASYSQDSSIYRIIYGFGYDSSTDDYSVVLGFYNCNTNLLDFEIFSLRSNNWKQIVVGSHFPYILTAYHESEVGLFFNASIHWLIYNYETNREVIIAFHLKEMRMSEIALPDDFHMYSSVSGYDLFVFGGLIGVWIEDIYEIKIRVMKEYAVYSSWTETVSFSARPNPTFSSVCFTNCGDLVGSSGGGLAKFNDKGELLEERSYPDCFFERSQMTVYKESLLSLPDSSDQS
ncbi:unnamed protein product [Trifolium pratense]|uniref:Uncharacterized protein n=1 Tax=Trifolium pratense TaxID=57577 RepID=A0ACB0LRF8_TRIPR|nr:unnamed protein product [Trifolium pratense]